MVCERCGSAHVRRIRSTSFERFLRVFTGKKRFLCRHCGWSALRAWDETARRVDVPKTPERAALKLVDLTAIESEIERHSKSYNGEGGPPNS